MKIMDQINRAVKPSLLLLTSMMITSQVSAQAETMTDSEKEEMLERATKMLESAEGVDKQKSSSAFRDWKRKHRETSDTPAFRRALRHQLNWLLISIEAAHDPAKIEQLGIKALAKVDAMIDDAELLKPNKNILSKAVLSTVYAKAYDLDTLGAKKWPSSPASINEIYENVVMPPLRVPRNCGVRIVRKMKRRLA